VETASRSPHKPMRSRAASTGRRLLVEDDDGVSGATPTLSRPIAWAAGVGGPSSSHRGACPDGRPGGGGVRSATLGRSREVRPRPPVCARFRSRLRSSARARTARSRVVRCERLVWANGTLAAMREREPRGPRLRGTPPERPLRTRRGGATRPRVLPHYDRAAPGRASGRSPSAARLHGRRWSTCGARRRP
jgi:hypothetical protein